MPYEPIDDGREDNDERLQGYDHSSTIMTKSIFQTLSLCETQPLTRGHKLMGMASILGFTFVASHSVTVAVTSGGPGWGDGAGLPLDLTGWIFGAIFAVLCAQSSNRKSSDFRQNNRWILVWSLLTMIVRIVDTLMLVGALKLSAVYETPSGPVFWANVISDMLFGNAFVVTAVLASLELNACPGDVVGETRACLCLVDVQKAYWSNSVDIRKDFEGFPERIAKLLDVARDAGWLVVHLSTDYDVKTSKWIPQFRSMNPKKPCSLPFRGASRLETFAKPCAGEIVLGKDGWCGGLRTGLVEMLQEKGIRDAYVAGLITSCCVQATAFSLFDAGFRTSVVEDCCADRGLERHKMALSLYGDYMYHVTSLAHLKPCAVDVDHHENAT